MYCLTNLYASYVEFKIIKLINNNHYNCLRFLKSIDDYKSFLNFYLSNTKIIVYIITGIRNLICSEKVNDTESRFCIKNSVCTICCTILSKF